MYRFQQIKLQNFKIQIRNGSWENSKKTLGSYFFAAPCRSLNPANKVKRRKYENKKKSNADDWRSDGMGNWQKATRCRPDRRSTMGAVWTAAYVVDDDHWLEPTVTYKTITAAVLEPALSLAQEARRRLPRFLSLYAVGAACGASD